MERKITTDEMECTSCGGTIPAASEVLVIAEDHDDETYVAIICTTRCTSTTKKEVAAA